MTDYPWEPPRAGTDAEQLFGSIDRMRWTFCYKVDGLDLDALSFRIPSSQLSLGVLLKHLAVCEDVLVGWKIRGRVPEGADPRLGSDDDDEWQFSLDETDTAESLYAGWASAVVRSRAAVAEIMGGDGLDAAAAISQVWGETVSVRRILSDFVEEYSRHTGHADLLREAIDGRVGEDPPAGWRPVSLSLD